MGISPSAPRAVVTTVSPHSVPSPGATIAQDDVNDQVAQIEPMLERCTWQGPGVLMLKGVCSVYRSDPPLNLGWLEGALSPDEYSTAIRQLSTAALSALVGQPTRKRYLAPPIVAHRIIRLDSTTRNSQRFQASQAAAAALSSKYASRGILFTVEVGTEKMMVVDEHIYRTVRDPIAALVPSERDHCISTYVQTTRLYITLPSASGNGTVSADGGKVDHMPLHQ
jgi:hypothetical protein